MIRPPLSKSQLYAMTRSRGHLLEDKLHIGRATGFSPCCTDMFTDVRSRTDDFGLADVVVLEEDHFEEITDIWVVVHDLPDLVDEVNDLE